MKVSIRVSSHAYLIFTTHHTPILMSIGLTIAAQFQSKMSDSEAWR
jgi:hypothetical protein